MIRHLVALAAVAGPAAAAEELVSWGTSGEWTILVDPAVGNGCLMQKQFEDGTLVQFGTVPDRKGGFVAVYNPDWTGIEDGVTGTVKFEFPKHALSVTPSLTTQTSRRNLPGTTT